MRNACWAAGLLLGFVCAGQAQRPLKVRITVWTDRVERTMRGGIGASWHAIEDPKPGQRKIGGVLAGSAWGANPPAGDEAAWRSLLRHADWLGMDWMRIEIEQRMYEPRRREFDWDNPEMRILYRILDWADRRGVDVFLQQMWSATDWNAYPELRGTLEGRLISAPLSMDDFAYGLGELVEHLTTKRRYRCVRWVAINNEPGYDWSWWQGPDRKPLPITPGLAAARKEFDRRGIAIPLSGPDWTDLPELVPAKIDFDEYIGAYDLHSYFAHFDGETSGYPLSKAEERLRAWAGWAHARNKPFFLSELGSMVFGWRDRHPGPGSYEAGLKDAALAVRAMRAGADGLNRWSFVNRGDLDGQWQLVDTWDMDAGKLRPAFAPHPNTYYLYGLLSRLTAKHSQVLATETEADWGNRPRRIVATVLRSPKGQLSLLVVNETAERIEVAFRLDELTKKQKLHHYRITEANRDRPDVEVRPVTEFRLSKDCGEFFDTIPALSVSVYSTYRLAPDEPGITVE